MTPDFSVDDRGIIDSSTSPVAPRNVVGPGGPCPSPGLLVRISCGRRRVPPAPLGVRALKPAGVGAAGGQEGAAPTAGVDSVAAWPPALRGGNNTGFWGR